MSENGWHRVDSADVPEDGRVRSVVVDGRTVVLSRCGARLGALENRCPHQGGPLGEGSIEKGLLRCPWHGYDYDPLTGLLTGLYDAKLDQSPMVAISGQVPSNVLSRRAPLATKGARHV